MPAFRPHSFPIEARAFTQARLRVSQKTPHVCVLIPAGYVSTQIDQSPQPIYLGKHPSRTIPLNPSRFKTQTCANFAASIKARAPTRAIQSGRGPHLAASQDFIAHMSALARAACHPPRTASLLVRRRPSRAARHATRTPLLSLHAILRVGMVGTPQGHGVLFAHDVLGSQPTRDEVVRQVQTAVVLRIHAVKKSAVI